MKGTILILSTALMLGCAPQKDNERTGKPLVFVSIPPLAGLLREIAGDRLDIRTLVGQGQSPHSYEPTARQLAALGEADLLFTIGVPYEKSLLNKIKPLYPDLEIVATDSRIERRSMPHEHHGEACTHDHGEKDPHVWLSAVNAMKISEDLLQALARNRPEQRDLFEANQARLVAAIQKLHTQSQAKLAPFKGCRFYVFHPSFGYFAEEYGLEQVAIELDGKAPSPRQLAALIEQAKVDGAKIVFVQKQFPVDSAQALATALDGSVVQLDPLSEDVVANLRQIADSIALAMEHP
ncbi:metal ABC transporter solute-binding protein, Zn/Mn family, partial [Pontiella sp.]|uniref:metal ABC transporter solute-binding protein, Zn/Mn family n=1 Tax=Pontiella sp. TaxID=2837462 RepID=UPI003564339F